MSSQKCRKPHAIVTSTLEQARLFGEIETAIHTVYFPERGGHTLSQKAAANVMKILREKNLITDKQ